jgi:restriction system protein
MTKDDIPKYPDLMNPLLQALRDLGGSGSISETHDSVVDILNLSDGILYVPHNPDKTNRSELEYQLGWTRTYLKKYGLLENSSRGVWIISPNARDVEEVDPRAVSKYVRELNQKKLEERQEQENGEIDDGDEIPEEARPWRSKLHRVLTQKMDSDAFERLTKRLLRESGFVPVEVTGRSGDGGVDGKGIMQIGGLLSFHVVFQCKRYQGSVSTHHVRDFRGAMVGRADKGLLITTGHVHARRNQGSHARRCSTH